MAKTGNAPQKPARKSSLAVRIALFVTLALVIVCAVRWFSLKRDLQRGVDLYDAGKFQEAADVLQPLVERPLARLRIREKAKLTLGLCKEGLADEAAKAMTAEGYRKALKLLAEARGLAGPTPGIEKGILDYTEYLKNVEHRPTPVAAPPMLPPVPPAPSAPPAPPPAMTPKGPPATSPPS